jgi:hypothetical protein
MSQVFITYRQTDYKQRKRVRDFGERLRACHIKVVLDQFFLDENPAGPNDGWPKWSSDCALKTDYVLIVGTHAWFQCFNGSQNPGTGLGAACEAGDIRTRIYKKANVIETIRIVLFDDRDEAHVPDKLIPYHRFHAKRDFLNIVRWLGGKLPSTRTTKNLSRGSISLSRRKSPKLRKEDNPFQMAGALPHDHKTYIQRVSDHEFERVISGPARLISITGEFGIGKSSLMQQSRRIRTDCQFFGGGLADLEGYDEALFMKNFFGLFAERFGAISKWNELEDQVRDCPSILFLDDVAEVAAPGLSALIPALIARLSEHDINLQVVATSSQPLQAVFNARRLQNPKYSRPWVRIAMTTCDEAEAHKLLCILPARSHKIAMDQLSKIKEMSRFAPQRLQRLCYCLFNGECDDLSDQELSTLVVSSATYE